MNTNVIGLDISKNVFHLYSQTGNGTVVKKKLKRGKLPAYIANIPVSLIGRFCTAWLIYCLNYCLDFGGPLVILRAVTIADFKGSECLEL